ncbi:DoxX family protein [Saccharibacillus sacchari]|uniref:DoxX family protein n=1 Tax=Saccharibacillus sacchari TaxID=456493 RepID=A0ACC6PFB3_9BACL
MAMKWTATTMRLVLGIIFLGHGISKLSGGIGNTADWFVTLGLPEFLAYMIAMLELVCGTTMMLGLLTRMSAVGFVAVMIGAIVTVKLPAGLLGSTTSPGYELDLALMALAAYFIVSKETGVGVDSLLAERDADEKAAAVSKGSVSSPASNAA